MTKNISLSDIKDISKSLYSECIEHGYKIKFPSEEVQLYPITDLTIAIYSRGEFTKNVGEIDPFSFACKKFEPVSEGVNMCCNTLEIEKVIFKGIAVLLENGAVLILNKQDRPVQQIISVNEISEILNNRYSMVDKSFDLDPCTSERYYKQMLGYKFIDISNEAPEILEQLEKGLKERQQILDKIEELEKWLEKFDQKIKDRKTITSQELNERDSKKSELDSLKNKLENINFRLT